MTLIRYKDSASQKFRRDNGALPYVVRLHFKIIQCDFNYVKLFSIIKIQNNSCHQRMEVNVWFRFLNWKIISNYFWNVIWQKCCMSKWIHLDDFKCDNLNLEMLFCGILFNNYKTNYFDALIRNVSKDWNTQTIMDAWCNLNLNSRT